MSNLASTFELAEAKRSAPAHSEPAGRARGRWLELALLAVAAMFFALHFVHLKADFPNHSPWMDWSKYTDEGWYGDAAIRHYELGRWYVAGDFNPAAALPVWPLLEMALFRFTGVSVVAARALTVTVFGLMLLCCYLLIRRWGGSTAACGQDAQTVFRAGPAVAVLLLAVSPFCYVFFRLAILEPLLILLTLLACLAASRAGKEAALAWRRGAQARGRWVAWAVLLGLLLALMVLTKTTGIFLFPAVFWLLWAAAYRMKPIAMAAGAACGAGVALWGGYYLLFVRPHYLLDYRYLFSANAYTGITASTAWPVIHDAALDLSWMGSTLAVLAAIAVAGWLAVLVRWRSRTNPLAVALLLWIFGYAAFLIYHANLQPRYYLVLAVPLTMLTAMGFDELLDGARLAQGGWRRAILQCATLVGGVALLVATVHGGEQVAEYAGHPEYGWWSAAQQVRAAVDREAAASGGASHSRLLLSISGSDISLMAGVPSICDDFGTMTLADRVETYRPGWFATWNYVEDDKMEALAPGFKLERVMTVPVFDDPGRNLLILYRLDPVGPAARLAHSGKRRFPLLPRRLRTRIGEQPSPVQLRH